MDAGDGVGTFDPPGAGGEVLDALGLLRTQEHQRDVALVLLAAQWVSLNRAPVDEHAPESHQSQDSRGLEGEALTWRELGKRGCFEFDEFTIPAFAIAAGITEYRAQNLIHEAIVLVYLLPRVWHRAQQGDIQVWRARKLAEACWGLCARSLDYVDAHMSRSNARHTEAGRDGVIREARLRFMADEVAREDEALQDKRCAILDWRAYGQSGLVELYACLDAVDARNLEAALTQGARALKDQGSQDPLETRRAWALGDLARSWLSHEGAQDQPGQPKTRAVGEVKVHLHLTPDAFLPQPGDGVAPGRGFSPIRMQGPGIPKGVVVTPTMVQEWFTRPSTTDRPRIVFRPVIDLEDHHHVDAYEVPERLKEHVGLRDGGCVFPWCQRQAHYTDCDHVIAHSAGGPTCTCNLAPLCRRHHRIKTHADNHAGNPYTWWRYESLGDGQYLWTGPRGTVLLRTNSGVHELNPPRFEWEPDRDLDEILGRIRSKLPPAPPDRFPPSERKPDKPPQPQPTPDLGPPPF